MCNLVDVQKCERNIKEKCEIKDKEVCKNVTVKNEDCSYVYDKEEHCETHPVKTCTKVTSLECYSEKECQKETCETVYEKKCYKSKIKQCKDQIKMVCKNVPETVCKKEPVETCRTVQEKKCLDEKKVRCKGLAI